MKIADITVEVEGSYMDATIKYNLERGQDAITHLAPEDCQEGFPDEWELSDLVVAYHKDNAKIKSFVDLSGLLSVPDIRKSIINSIWEYINAN